MFRRERAILKRGEIGARAQCELHKVFGIVWSGLRSDGRFVNKFVLDVTVGTEDCVQIGHGGGGEFCGVENEQLRLRNLHVGKAEVERRAQFRLREGADLVAGCLARSDGLLRNLENRLRCERLVESLVDRERDVLLGGALRLELCPGVGLALLTRL